MLEYHSEDMSMDGNTTDPIGGGIVQHPEYAGKPGLVHVADGSRRLVGALLAEYLDNDMRARAASPYGAAPTDPLCPGCYMTVLYNAAVTLARRNGQSMRELGATMCAAFFDLWAISAPGVEGEAPIMREHVDVSRTQSLYDPFTGHLVL